MPSKKQYDPVPEDGQDSKSPLHNDVAFQHGIYYQAKYIGSMEVPRPTSRVEIVAAMRRIRYEYKAKGVKKQKIVLSVSVDGVKVSTPKKHRRRHKWNSDDNRFILLQHPVYRIFYVSHDSQDLKIFSYIAREGATSVFRCNVFKSYKKNQAMQIVRTIGQAFEVCHKISIQQQQQSQSESMTGDQLLNTDDPAIEGGSEKSSEPGGARPQISHSSSTLQSSPVESSPTDIELMIQGSEVQSPEELLSQRLTSSLNIRADNRLITSPYNKVQQNSLPHTLVSPGMGGVVDSADLGGVGGARVQLLLQEVELQTQQTQFLYSQLQLLKQQLAAERAAKIDAQTRTSDLLSQNRSLLTHMNVLITRLAQLECYNGSRSVIGGAASTNQNQPFISPQIMFNRQQDASDGHFEDPFRSLQRDVTNISSINGSLAHNALTLSSNLSITNNNNNSYLPQESPDSGHRDMSSESPSINNMSLGVSSSQTDAWFTPASVRSELGGSSTLGRSAIRLGTSEEFGYHRANKTAPRNGLVLPLKNSTSEMLDDVVQSNMAHTGFDKSYYNNHKTGGYSVISVDSVLAAQDLTSEVIDSNLSKADQDAPRIEPPPRNCRGSSRFTRTSPLATIHDSPISRSHDWTPSASRDDRLVHQVEPVEKKRYSWESYMLSDRNLTNYVDRSDWNNYKQTESNNTTVLNGSDFCENGNIVSSGEKAGGNCVNGVDKVVKQNGAGVNNEVKQNGGIVNNDPKQNGSIVNSDPKQNGGNVNSEIKQNGGNVNNDGKQSKNSKNNIKQNGRSVCNGQSLVRGTDWIDGLMNNALVQSTVASNGNTDDSLVIPVSNS